MQTKSGAALVAPRGEKRIEGAAANVEAHAASVVGKDDLDIILAGLANLDVDRAWLAVRECMRHGVQEQVSKYLPVWTGITIHHEIGLAIDIERQVVLAQARPQAHHHLLGEIAETET